MRRSFMKSALLAALTLGLSTSAYAVPVLQLDIQDGFYDFHEQTIIASSNPFTLYAIATPNAKNTKAKLLADTFYISAAVTPMVPEPGASLGSFTWNGETIRVTEDMTFGKPPMEEFAELQGFDRGDLQGHGIYPTYFREFVFTFSGDEVQEYNTAENPGGPSAGTGSLMKAFTVDTSLLNTNYRIHFDMYNVKARQCGVMEQEATNNDPSCLDNDVALFAPFSHDAQSPPVPEPATMVLFGTGLAAGAYRKYRNRRND